MDNSTKNRNLQGLRGIAILSVLAFHFYPSQFPNGYLGVDQFFVLSGFLMAMLLSRSSKTPHLQWILNFYWKRLRRILPVYLLTILFSMIGLYSIFPVTAIETNRKSALKALSFTSNRVRTEQEGYFEMLTIAIDIFLHTWSLSVEVQFYLIAPFIYLLSNRLASHSKHQYACYTIIGVGSLCLFYHLESSLAFNSVFSRVWQFLIGMMMFSDTKMEKEQSVHQFPLSISIIFLQTCPFHLSESIARPLITILTGLLIRLSVSGSICVILSSKVLNYIGDISYSLYLIHWPIYAHWKLTNDNDQAALAISLAISIAISIILFETFEKWSLQLSPTSIGALLVLLYASNMVLIYKDQIVPFFESAESRNSTFDKVERKNYEWNVNDYENLYTSTCDYEAKHVTRTPLGWCNHTGLNPNSPYKMAIIGNSWTANHAKLIYEECGDKANIILQGATGGCEPLYPTLNASECIQHFHYFVERIHEARPDFVFLVSRWISIGENSTESFESDAIYQVMKSQALKLASSTKKKLFILDAIPFPNPDNLSKVVPMLKEQRSTEEIDKLLFNPESEQGYKVARKRHAQLVKDGRGKIELIDYLPLFLSRRSSWRYYDQFGYSYFTTPVHFSPRGLEHVRGVWRKLCSRL